LSQNTPLGNSNAVKMLWTASRNATYLLLVLLLVAAGFMIMFRVKVNPQTVVSLQSMIPKLIASVLLITFSFAIAGFIIDMVYVFLAAFVGFLGLGGAILTKPVELLRFITSGGFTHYFVSQSITSMLLVSLLGGILAIISAGLIFIPGGVAVGLVTSIAGLVLIILVGIFWLVIMFKIGIMLVKSYVMLILQIIIAPWQIMLGMLPGQSGFSGWFRNTIAHASVFVVVPIMFVIQHILGADLANFKFGINSTTLPLVDLPLLPNFGNPYLLNWIVGFVILSLTPKIAEIVRDTLKIPAFKYGNAIGEATNLALFGPRTGAGAIRAQFEGDLKQPTTVGWERQWKQFGANVLQKVEKGV
jgi:hypothetical protein